MIDKQILACDVDNTVADQHQRYVKYFDPKTRKINRRAFTEKEISKDKPIPGAVEAISELSSKFRIVWISARPKAQYELTHQWLTKHHFRIDELFLVESHNQKIPFLRELKPYVFIDDLKYDWETLDPKLKTDYILDLEKSGISYEVFNNNWTEIVNKFLCQEVGPESETVA